MRHRDKVVVATALDPDPVVDNHVREPGSSPRCIEEKWRGRSRGSERRDTAGGEMTHADYD